MDWLQEVKQREEQFLEDAKGLLRIPSVKDVSRATPDAPFGPEVKQALTYMLQLGERDGFITKEVENVAGHIEHGDGEEIVGVLCHVDVVPAGKDGWQSQPFEPVVEDGKLIARGAMDDKGPTIAAYMALSLLKELGVPMKRKIRIIVGTDEESDWECVHTYFQKEEMPVLGFAPDADFPIIYAEKGIVDLDYTIGLSSKETAVLRSFQSGERYNMVPDEATATVSKEIGEHVLDAFQTFLRKTESKGSLTELEGELHITIKGKAHHAMAPQNGVNAGVLLADFLYEQKDNLDEDAKQFVSFLHDVFLGDTTLSKVGMDHENEELGDLTCNVGVIRYEAGGEGKIGCNIRYPSTFDFESEKVRLTQKASEYNLKESRYTNEKPHHVDKENPLIQTLQRVYEEQTGEEATLLTIGGGTYARSLNTGVAFGPMFPGREDVAHQPNEYMYVEDLLRAAALYAQAMYELANAE
ncbi:dipeptidase PepV [Bacillus fonticola]|uniref:dipeptidase PepV n=1 Tax=Bacillus fonticola TaxID=2728853 RepID=UPI00147621AF|nr:dipeptidase PepV [Bacillus fonticola]